MIAHPPGTKKKVYGPESHLPTGYSRYEVICEPDLEGDSQYGTLGPCEDSYRIFNLTLDGDTNTWDIRIWHLATEK
jgi:hypothetical protein